MARLVKKCPCLRPKIEEEIRILDYRHSSLRDVPSEVFNVERTLEELYTDSNQIRDLPRELFYCHGLRKLSISDNEITSIPAAISNLGNLEELDLSKNGIIEVPETIKACKYLHIIDASVNPLGKLPEGFTQLANLTHLYLNDTFIDYLPGSFGRMTKLEILEIRENHLKTLPHSFGRLASLERLDIGNNEFTELSDVIGSLSNLLELWCDNNQITAIHPAISSLKQLIFLDASKNQLQELPKEIEGCLSLADIHLTTNNLQSLPDSIGNLNNLTTLKVDDNRLKDLPKTLGGLSSLSELNVSENDLVELPSSIGLLRNLRTFYADENILQSIPAELGSCSGITILSLRSNKLTFIPDEVGRIPRLRVLNLSDNLLSHLPFTVVKLKELQALWLSENQTRPLIPLQSEYEEETGRKILTCYLLPQGQLQENDERNHNEDSTSFHASMWDEERIQRQQIQFDFNDSSDEEGTLVRCPTPYPKEMRGKVRHARNLAMRYALNDDQKRTDNFQGNEEETSKKATPTATETAQSALRPSKSADHMDGRMREAQVTKPSSKLQESHRLYRFDKEKQLKDKVRMQHRLSNVDVASDAKCAFGQDYANKREKTSNLTGSTPDLSALNKDSEKSPIYFGMPAMQETNVNVYEKQLLSQHRGRRSRRMRDYDSDTGYRSDVDVRFPFDSQTGGGKLNSNSDSISVRSQPTSYHYHNFKSSRHPHRKQTCRFEDQKYNTDVENYDTPGFIATGIGVYHQQNMKKSSSDNWPRGRPSQSSNSSDGNNFNPCPPVNSDSHSFFSATSYISDNHQLHTKGNYQYHSSSNFRPSTSHDNLSLSNVITSNCSSKPNGEKCVSAMSFSSKGPHISSHSPHLHQPKHFHGEIPPPVMPKPTTHNVISGSSVSVPTCVSSMFHNESFLGQSSPVLNNAPTSVAHVNANQARGCEEGRGSNPISGSEEKEALQLSSYPCQISCQTRGTLPPYPHLPPYRRQYENHQPQQIEGRKLHGSSIHGTGSPQVLAISTSVSQGPKLDLSASHQYNNPCGFHGSNHYSDFLSSSRETASHRNKSDSDCNSNNSREIHFQHETASSSSASNQQYQPIKRCDRNKSDLSYYRRDVSSTTPPVNVHQQSNDSYSVHKSLPQLAQPLDMNSNSFEIGHLDDIAPNQEQSSQVSSSTDSGYGHCYHVYERIGDLSNLSSKNGPGSHSSGPTSTPPSQRHTPTRRLIENSLPCNEMPPVRDQNLQPDSTTKHHRDEFRITIKKDPDLGFCIAGGIDSMGNPYRINDQGIFVTKIIPNGPASSLLRLGDKILEVNNIDFRNIQHDQAISTLKSNQFVNLLVERIQKVNMV